jgi:cytidylate kinase
MLNTRICSICAWRENCQKRFIISMDSLLNVHCPDYTRDVRIKEDEIEGKVVEYHMQRWRMIEKPRPDFMVTVSRQAGAGGSEIARRLAEEFKMDLVGSQIIKQVAKSAKMSTKVVESLDEKAVTQIDSVIASLFANRHLSPDVYFRHLTSVIVAIGEHGYSIIVGRGAHMILSKEKTLRLRFIAPQESRVAYFLKTRAISRDEARRYVEKKDADRNGFIKKYFKHDANDPTYFDMIINTEQLGMEGAYQTVATTVRYRLKIAQETGRQHPAKA